MNHTRPPRREHKLIAFKAFFDTDRDILEWWEGMQEGIRSQVLRDLLRLYLQGLPLTDAARHHSLPLDGSLMLQVREDTAWIRDALQHMPTCREGLRTHSAPDRITPDAGTQPADSQLSDEALARRRAKMGRAAW